VGSFLIATQPTVLLIRADASSEIGSGHVMRCLALAQAWRKQGGHCVFVLAAGIGELDERLRAESFDVVRGNFAPGGEVDATETRQLCKDWQASWLVVDGFHFGSGYLADVRNSKPDLLIVDDDGARRSYDCDLILNVNPQASEGMYQIRPPDTPLLLGPRFSLVREEFLSARTSTFPSHGATRRILVTFGGSDLDNVTLKAVTALNRLSDLNLEVTVIIGASNPHYESLAAATLRSAKPVKLLRDVRDMPRLMAESDLAIAAGGGTCFELAFMRVPMFLITIAENHEETVQAWDRAGAAVGAGWFSSFSEDELVASLRKLIADGKMQDQLRDKAGQLVDGCGAIRVVEMMHRIRQDRRLQEQSVEP
jgi:UDP-2,4-diacetamido-2,4,6-trideoxy-beta-L-altropyranose hydrolase